METNGLPDVLLAIPRAGGMCAQGDVYTYTYYVARHIRYMCCNEFVTCTLDRQMCVNIATHNSVFKFDCKV